MPEYTLELRTVIDLEGRDNIGLNDYPIFDEQYRDALNNKIIEHFWNREIGMESVSMFRQQLRRKMHEIMPYWNQHYKATQIQFDPLKTMSIKSVSGSTGETNTTGEGNSDTTSTSKARAVGSTMPQVMLSGNGDYADSANDNVGETEATGTTSETQSTTSNGNVDTDTSGYQGSAAILIAEYRATFVNTDMDVINQLEPLFMGIWGTTDDYFERGFTGYGYYGFRGFAF